MLPHITHQNAFHDIAVEQRVSGGGEGWNHQLIESGLLQLHPSPSLELQPAGYRGLQKQGGAQQIEQERARNRVPLRWQDAHNRLHESPLLMLHASHASASIRLQRWTFAHIGVSGP